MKPTGLIVASVILLVLAGGVYWAKRHPSTTTSTDTSTPPAPKLADIPANQVTGVDITKKDGSKLDLQQQNGKWVITAPAQYAADQDSVSSMLSALSPLNADSVAEDKPANVAPFGLDAPSLTVAVHEKNGKNDQIQIGNDVPAGSLVYARYGSDPKVYALSNSVKTSFDKSVNDLRDKRLLTFDSTKLTRVELASSKGDVEFGKNNQGDWTILKPQPYRADNFQVEDLVRKLGDAKMDLSSTAPDPSKSESAFASGKQIATAKTTDASGTQTVTVRKNKDDYYATSSVVKGAYKITSDLGQAVDKGPDDFRNKKIFDFGFNDPNKIEVQQGSDDKTYMRSGTDWKRDGKTMDPGNVQSFIDKLRDLSATKFDAAGFTTPAATITVISNDNKRTEKVDFAKVADGYLARRENEPTLYRLDAKAVNDTLEASKGIKPAASSSKK